MCFCGGGATRRYVGVSVGEGLHVGSCISESPNQIAGWWSHDQTSTTASKLAVCLEYSVYTLCSFHRIRTIHVRAQGCHHFT